MRTTHARLLPIASFLVLLFFLAGCKEEQRAERATESAPPATTAAPEKPEKPAGPIAPNLEPDLRALVQAGLGELTAETLGRLFDESCKQAVVVNTQALLGAGLVDRVLRRLPSKEGKSYRDFVKESGFDPRRAYDGIWFWSHAEDFEKLDSSTAESVLAVAASHSVVADTLRFFSYLENALEDESEEDGKAPLTVLVGAPVSAAELEAVTALLLGDEGFALTERAELGPHSRVLTGTEEDGRVLAYVWDGGMLLDFEPAGDPWAMEDALRRVAAWGKRISAARASATRPSPAGSGLAWMRLTDDDGTMEISLATNTGAVELDVRAPAEVLGKPAEVRQMVLGWREFLAMPEATLREAMASDDLPQEYLPLAVKLLRSSQLSMDGSAGIRVAIKIDEDELVDLLPLP